MPLNLGAFRLIFEVERSLRGNCNSALDYILCFKSDLVVLAFRIAFEERGIMVYRDD